MPDLAEELAHLGEANGHIADGERLVARLEQLIDRMSRQGGDTTKAKESLRAMRAVLVTFHEYRAAIAQTIDDIRSGKFNPRP